MFLENALNCSKYRIMMKYNFNDTLKQRLHWENKRLQLKYEVTNVINKNLVH